MGSKTFKGIDLLSDSFVQEKLTKKSKAAQKIQSKKELINVSALSELKRKGFESMGTGIYKDAQHHLWTVEKSADGFTLMRASEEGDADKGIEDEILRDNNVDPNTISDREREQLFGRIVSRFKASI